MLRHTGSVMLLDTPCGLLNFVRHGTTFLNGFHPRVVDGRSGVGWLGERRQAKQDAERESGNECLHSISP